MDFATIRMDDFLKASIPNRFQDVTPFDFEDFIAYMFGVSGYEVTQTDYTGDFGADLITTFEDETTAVQVKRYQPNSPVGAPDINQIIGAKTFYKTDHALILTTSRFTQAAEQLALSADVELWEWEDLLREISNLWLDGKDYFEYFSNEITEEAQNRTDLELYPIDFDVDEANKYCFLQFEIENNGTESLKCQLDLPLILTKSKKQIQASKWSEDYFSQGLIYAGARVTAKCLFRSDQINSLEKGDRLIQRIFLMDQNSFVTIDEQLVNKPGSCFIVTHCYGKYSPEYVQMILFRDHVLMNSAIGRLFTSFYYRCSPIWFSLVEHFPMLLYPLKIVAIIIVNTILYLKPKQGIKKIGV